MLMIHFTVQINLHNLIFNTKFRNFLKTIQETYKDTTFGVGILSLLQGISVTIQSIC